MSRCVVNVATGRYIAGQDRLKAMLVDQLLFSSAAGYELLAWTDTAAIGAPTHQEKPYAFKAVALREAARQGYRALLWADACIVLNGQPLDRIWERAAQEGVWLSRNGYWNIEWTALEAYGPLGVTPEENAQIPHVVATAFALDLNHPKGAEFLKEYYRLASETDAFCGPWTGGVGVQHRHDQTAASVIAARLQIPLTDPPDFFAYRGGETERTLLMADGDY